MHFWKCFGLALCISLSACCSTGVTGVYPSGGLSVDVRCNASQSNNAVFQELRSW